MKNKKIIALVCVLTAAAVGMGVLASKAEPISNAYAAEQEEQIETVEETFVEETDVVSETDETVITDETYVEETEETLVETEVIETEETEDPIEFDIPSAYVNGIYVPNINFIDDGHTAVYYLDDGTEIASLNDYDLPMSLECWRCRGIDKYYDTYCGGITEQDDDTMDQILTAYEMILSNEG